MSKVLFSEKKSMLTLNHIKVLSYTPSEDDKLLMIEHLANVEPYVNQFVVKKKEH